MLYQLSYFRKNKPHQSAPRCLERLLQPRPVFSGKRWIRTTEGVRQQIYSLPHLATLVSSQYFVERPTLFELEPMEGFEPTTPRLQITCSGQLSYIGNKPLRDAKVEIFFNSANFFATFFTFLLFFFQKSSFFAFPDPPYSPKCMFKEPLTSLLANRGREIECKYNHSFRKKKVIETFFYEKVKKIFFTALPIYIKYLFCPAK